MPIDVDTLHLRRMAALAEVSMEHAEVAALLGHVVAITRDLLPATAASLILWDADQERWEVSASTLSSQPGSFATDRARRTAGATRWIVDEQQPLAVRDIADDPFGASTMLTEHGLHAYLGVPVVFEGESLGALYALDATVREYTDGDVDFMTVLARRASSAIGLARLLEQLRTLASLDELTGLWNRREFLSRGGREVERQRRTERPLSAIVFDIDDFKSVNDRFGHLTGDLVLAEVAARVAACVRSIDLVARIGGEEFALLLPDSDATTARTVAERLCAAVRNMPVTTPAGAIDVTITAGVAAWSASHEDLPSLLHEADVALYRGKQSGRDRVEVATD